MFLHPTTIWLILFSIWAVIISCNFYVGYVQVQLFHRGLLSAKWSLGSSILKSALESATDRRDIKMIRRAMVVFRISTGAFLSFILGIVLMAV
jgi:hypothetical protein